MANSVFIGPFGFVNNGTQIVFPLPGAFPDGTAAAPSIASSSATSHGFYFPSSGYIGVASGSTPGNVEAIIGGGGIFIKSGDLIGWTNSATNAFSGTADVLLARDAANTLALRNGTAAQQFNVGPAGNLISLIGSVAAAASYLEGLEGTAPAAGAVNTGRIFFQDNGGGKTQLMVIFNSGAAQQIAIQP